MMRSYPCGRPPTQPASFANPVSRLRLSAWPCCGRYRLGPHGTADEVAEVVRSEIGAISRQVVYDALRMLPDKGLIRRIQPPVHRPVSRTGSEITITT
jgi:Fur family ferric uptake transcriptional regulator